jgi:NADP-dependent 3-hydroxy acid dehydrogenase YdfG
MSRETDLRNKWVLITGASSGFGAAAARAFAGRGSKLLLGARRKERLEEVAAEARSAGAQAAHVFVLDVSQTAGVEAFFAAVRRQTERLDVLINNAGGAHGLDPIAQGKDEDWDATVQTNVLGLLRVTRAALPLMLKNPGSTIINIGSLAGRVAYEGGSAYCAAKGVNQLERPRPGHSLDHFFGRSLPSFALVPTPMLKLEVSR